MMNLRTPQIEITTLAEIPSGTGLGSSGSFTTALVKALYAHRRRLLHSSEVARLACEIEIDRLHEPVGKQDQYIAAYGGVTCFDFHPDGSVAARPLTLGMETMFELEDNLLLFFTGFSRSAGSLLHDQKARSEADDAEMIDNLHYVKDLGYRSQTALEAGGGPGFWGRVDKHWGDKKSPSRGKKKPRIDEGGRVRR